MCGLLVGTALERLCPPLRIQREPNSICRGNACIATAALESLAVIVDHFAAGNVCVNLLPRTQPFSSVHRVVVAR